MLEKIGKYEVSEQIGVGGFGAVYRGRDPFIKRTVAIKTCQVNDDEIKHRFFREAELAGNLHHRHITTIYDFGVENGIPYIVQEFLTGEDLDKKIKRGEPLSVARKVEILMAIADGLAYAHNANIVHRDVKPANVRVLDDGTVKVMDFGIAKSLQTESNLTQTGITLGTSAYLAPEQIRGEPIDRRTDIFSMGVLSYELLTYRKPFRGEHLSTVLYKILNDTPEPVESLAQDVPPALVAAVNRAISKSPAERYQTMEAYRQDLHAVFRELTGSSGRYSRSLMDSSRAPRADEPDDLDTTLATPSSGVPPVHITPPSGALARQPVPSETTPTSASLGGIARPLELVNFRDPLADTVSEDAAPTVRRPAPPADEPRRRRLALIGGVVVAALAAAAAGYFLTRRGESAAPKPPPQPVASAPTPALEFPEPRMGQGESAAAPASVAAAPAVPTALPQGQPAAPAAAGGAPAPSTASAVSAPPPAAASAPAPPAAEKPAAPAKKYRVQFSSVPLATLSVDGKKIGPSIPARTLQLEEGSHVARFEAKGFPTHEQTFKVDAGAENRVHYQFPVSMLVVDAPAWNGARLLVDGKYRGNLPDAARVKLPPGSYSVTLSREGVSPVTEKIRVPEGAEKTWNPPPPSPAASGGTP